MNACQRSQDQNHSTPVDPDFRDRRPLKVLLDNTELGALHKKSQVVVVLLKAWEFRAQHPASKLFDVSRA